MGTSIFYPLTSEINLFIVNFNLANNFWTVSARALVFHISITSNRSFPLLLSMGTNQFLYPVKFTLVIDLFIENFNLANNFWTVSARVFIFRNNKNDIINNFQIINIRAFMLNVSISCDKVF